MKKSFIGIMVLATMFAGCTKDPVTGDDNNQNTGDNTDQSLALSFETEFAGTVFKTGFSADEKVTVFAADGTSSEFSVSEEEGKALLKGESVESGSYYAIYPAGTDASLAETKLVYSIPSIQTGKADGISDEYCFVAAKNEGGDNMLTFKNISGFISFTLPQVADEIVRMSLKSNGNKALAGECGISISNDIPTLMSLGEENSTELTILPVSGETLQAGVYNVAVVPQNQTDGITITLYGKDGNVIHSKSTGSVSVGMGTVADLGSIEIPKFSIVGAPELCSLSTSEYQLSVLPQDINVTEWRTSDSNIATVDQTGKVTIYKYGIVTVYAKAGEDEVSVTLTIPAGYYRDNFTEQTGLAKWELLSNHVKNGAKSAFGSAGNGEWYLEVTPYVANNVGRGDFSRKENIYLSTNYPIICVRIDDINDRTLSLSGQDIHPSRYINVNLDTPDKKYRGDLGGSNNKWVKKYKCSDGSSLLIYDLNTQQFLGNSGTKNMMPSDGTPVEFSLLQVKYADINRDQLISVLNPEDVKYRMFWFYTFASEQTMMTYLEGWSDESGITYEQAN